MKTDYQLRPAIEVRYVLFDLDGIGYGYVARATRANCPDDDHDKPWVDEFSVVRASKFAPPLRERDEVAIMDMLSAIAASRGGA